MMVQLPDNIISIHLPASKSISSRILILEFLSGKKIPVENLSKANDTLLMQKCLTQIKNQKSGTIDCQDAGTVFRFLTSVLSMTLGDWILTGNCRMQERPIKTLVDALKSIGADITYLNNEGFPPVRISGKNLNGGEISIPFSNSSQFITSLMMIAPFLPNGLMIHIDWKKYGSAPYIEMTAEIMRYFNLKVDIKETSISIQPAVLCPKPFFVENDWSAASYFFGAVSLQPQLTLFINGLFPKSIQGDFIACKWFEELGVQTVFSDKGILISNSGLKADLFQKNFQNYPDLAQTFVVCCTLLKIPSIFSGLSSLKLKETNRLEALYCELMKMNITVKVKNEILYISPSAYSIKKNIETYHDHRMAMAFALLELLYQNIEIKDKQVVKKSFPDFWKEFEKLKNSLH